MKSAIAMIVFGFWFGGTASFAALQFDADVGPNLKQQMLEDLKFVGALKSDGQTPLYQEIFGAFDGARLSKWFSSRVTTVGKSLCGSDNAVACVLSAWNNKIWITPNYDQFSQPQIARISVLFHEARHTESENQFWAHVRCPKPFLNEQGQDRRSIWTGALLQGEYACDIEKKGSYALQTILLKNIALHCSNCNSKVKADAEIFGNDQLTRIIYAPAVKEMKIDFGMK